MLPNLPESQLRFKMQSAKLSQAEQDQIISVLYVKVCCAATMMLSSTCLWLVFVWIDTQSMPLGDILRRRAVRCAHGVFCNAIIVSLI